MNFGKIIITNIILGLFVISLISFAVVLPTINSPNQTIASDDSIVDLASGINSSLEQAYDNANSSNTAISDSPQTLNSGSGGIIIDALGGIWKVLKLSSTTIYNLVTTFIFSKLFGSEQSAIILGTIATILIIVTILAVVKLLTQGEG